MGIRGNLTIRVFLGIDTSRENIAQGKPSIQSSPYSFNGIECAPSDLAVDGVWEPNIFTGGRLMCAHTDEWQVSGEHWWMVNLEHIFPISGVAILNRGDCCWDRLVNISVTFGETIGKMNVCGDYEGPGGSAEIVYITCHKSMLGQYVQISKPAALGPLQLCEVAVYR